MSGLVRRTAGGAVLVIVGALALAGCTGGGDPVDPTEAAVDPTATSDPAPEWTADELVEAVFARPEQEPLGSVEGELAYQDVPAPARADVLEVTAGEASTTVLLRLTYLGETDLVVDSSYLSPERTSHPDVRGLALQVPSENRRLRPDLTVEDANPELEPLCLCSQIPMKVFPDQSMVFTATFLPLEPETTSVDLEIVGFPLIEGIPVARS